VVTSFPGWVAPLAANGVANAAASSGGEAQTNFDLQALSAVSATEFTIEIDGQALRWRGLPQPWVHMVWPNPAGVPGARITAITPEGRSIVVFNESGHFGLKKMIDAAKRKRKDNGAFELTWENSGVAVTANLKIVGTTAPPAPVAQAAAPAAAGFKRLRLPDTVTAPGPVVQPAAAAAAGQAAPSAPVGAQGTAGGPNTPAAPAAAPGTPAAQGAPGTARGMPVVPGAPAAPPARTPTPVPATMPSPPAAGASRTVGAQP
jgi:type VI secretion system protein ImpL